MARTVFQQERRIRHMIRGNKGWRRGKDRPPNYRRDDSHGAHPIDYNARSNWKRQTSSTGSLYTSAAQPYPLSETADCDGYAIKYLFGQVLGIDRPMGKTND